MQNQTRHDWRAAPGPTLEQFASTNVWRSLPAGIRLMILHLRRAEAASQLEWASGDKAAQKPRYYFHVRGDGGIETDETGIEFESLDDAINDARQAAAEMVIDAVVQHSEVGAIAIDIADRSGRVVATVPLAAQPRNYTGLSDREG